MTDDRFAEAQLWADNPDAWQEPSRCDDWIRVMQEIAYNQGERPEDRAEAEMLVIRLEAAKRGPGQRSGTGAG
ncbi:MAG TPA: hypothetical protein VHX61_17190 [Rhizomicrobium sp.]|jgi:hypothetical protein|nr:hypothetical protein [Rhizomicrobium sp.]